MGPSRFSMRCVPIHTWHFPCIYTLVPEYLRLLGTREILLADYLSVQEIFSHLPTKIFLVHFSNQQVQALRKERYAAHGVLGPIIGAEKYFLQFPRFLL